MFTSGKYRYPLKPQSSTVFVVPVAPELAYQFFHCPSMVDLVASLLNRLSEQPAFTENNVHHLFNGHYFMSERAWLVEVFRLHYQEQLSQAEERSNAQQEGLAEPLGEQHDPALPQPLRQSSAHKPLPATVPRETRVLPPQESACPACGGGLSPLGRDISEQLELISNAFKVIETQRPKLSCCRCDIIVQSPMPSKPIERRPRLAGAYRHGEVRRTHDALPSVGILPTSGRGAQSRYVRALVRRCQ